MYIVAAICLIVCDALAVVITSSLSSDHILLLLCGLTTLLCLLFVFFFPSPHAGVKLGIAKLIISSLLLLVHVAQIIVYFIFTTGLASYALCLHPPLLLAFWFYLQRLKPETRQVPIDAGLQVQIEEALIPKKFHIKELIAATYNFTRQAGMGSFFLVCKGTLPDGQDVAVIRFDCPKNRRSNSSIVNQISFTTLCKHDRIVKFFGYCFTDDFLYFVYEYNENHRIKDWIFSGDTNMRRNLTIARRYQVGMDVAKVLDYANSHCKSVQIYPSPMNVLLDGSFKAKVANLEFWKFLSDKKEHIPAIRDERGDEGNVFRYGVFLLELVSGRRCWQRYGDDEIRNMLYWRLKDGKAMELVEPVLVINEGDGRKLELLLSVALLCVQQKSENRPSMAHIAAILLGHEP